jgi:hypothetical protein
MRSQILLVSEPERWEDPEDTQLWIISSGDNGAVRYDWDTEAVHVQLRLISQTLYTLASRGSASLSDKDGFGNTLLHVSTNYLICRWGPLT